MNLKHLIPIGYTDIHSHVLPGIDDGAKTINDSINLIKKFIDLRVTKITTTPHVMEGVWPNSKSLIFSKLDELKKDSKKMVLQTLLLMPRQNICWMKISLNYWRNGNL